jgi:hypothetical protein
MSLKYTATPILLAALGSVVATSVQVSAVALEVKAGEAGLQHGGICRWRRRVWRAQE